MRLLQIDVEGPGNERYSVEVDIEETANEHAVEIKYAVARMDRQPVVTKIYFDPGEGVVHMTGLEVAIAGYMACLIACGLGHLAQEILDCWKRGHRTPRQLLGCMRDKGHSISLSLVNCSVACLGSVVAGAP